MNWFIGNRGKRASLTSGEKENTGTGLVSSRSWRSSMRELVRTGLVGIATAGIGLALAFAQPGVSIEERLGLTWLFSARGPVETSDDVMVISLDRRSAELLGLPEKIRDWPRELYATLIERLSRDGAATISFDLIFEREREREPEGDAALADAITRAGRVVLFEGLELQRQPTPAAEDMPLGLLETQRLRPPIEAFAGAAAGLGPFPLPIVPDRVSQVWLFQPGAGGRPTLPAVALQRHALPVFERWLSLLKRADAGGGSTLPGSFAALGKAAELREAMTGLRRMFQADPSLGERMFTAIATADVDEPTRRLLRALTDLYDGLDSRYLNFYGPAGKVTTLSLGDVLNGTVVGAPWAGRSVFVGQSELYEPHNDAFITVYSRDDGVKIGGVEIAATAFANLLDGRMLEPSPYWLGAIAAFGLLIGAVAGLLPALWAVPACLAIGGLYFLGAEAVFARDAHWLPTAVPLLAQLPLGLFAGLFMQYREARRARENLSRAIRYYLPDKLAEGFADAPLDPLLLNEDAYAYCLITDASGFTRMAEKMTSKELKPVLEDYLGILFTAVENNGGRVTDSVGDGITAAWTTPTPDPDIAAKACKAALEIDREVQRFDQRHAPLSLPTRIGMNAGWVTLGHVGGAGRFTYTVVGDAVNTASRIEQLNKKLGTRILATRKVVEGVPDLTMRPLGRFQLFGKEEILEMVELCKAKETETHSYRTALFILGVQFFKEKNWARAAEIFTTLANDFDDGASRLYLEVCHKRITEKHTPVKHDVISLSSK